MTESPLSKTAKLFPAQPGSKLRFVPATSLKSSTLSAADADALRKMGAAGNFSLLGRKFIRGQWAKCSAAAFRADVTPHSGRSSTHDRAEPHCPRHRAWRSDETRCLRGQPLYRSRQCERHESESQAVSCEAGRC